MPIFGSKEMLKHLSERDLFFLRQSLARGQFYLIPPWECLSRPLIDYNHVVNPIPMVICLPSQNLPTEYG